MPSRLAALMLLLTLGVCPALPAAAQDRMASGTEVLYTVPGIAVDASGATTVAARDVAFVQGQRDAFVELLRRLGVDPDRVGAGNVSTEQITQLMQSFQVNDERTSPGRYRAELTFRFRPEAVRALLQRYNIGFTETVVQPVLVLPVYRTADRVVLWDSPNPWLDAWLSYSSPYTAVPIAVPFGELADVTAITAEQALAGDPAALGAMAARYGAGSAVVATATEQQGELNVALDRYGPDFSKTSTAVTVPRTGEQVPFADAVNYIAGELQKAPSVAGPPTTGQHATVALQVPFAAPDDWFQIRERLGRIPGIAAVGVNSLSLRQADLVIEFVGSEQQLREALAQQGLSLQAGPTAMQLVRTDGTLYR